MVGHSHAVKGKAAESVDGWGLECEQERKQNRSRMKLPSSALQETMGASGLEENEMLCLGHCISFLRLLY